MSANPDLQPPAGDVTDWLAMVMDRWQQRLSLDPSEMEALGEIFRGQAFTMAGVWDTAFLDDIAESIEEALVGQLSLDEWIANAQEILDRYGDATGLDVYTGEEFERWYAELVFRQATQSAYAAGNYASMFSPENIDFDPYWMYVTAQDDRVRPEHAALQGQIFRKRDEWARHFLPPLGFNCRCIAIPLDEDLKDQQGGDVADNRQDLDYEGDNGETVQVEPDEGFDVDKVAQLVPDILKRMGG